MRITLSLLVALAGSLSAQTAVTEPIGFNKITCLTNSDTIVGVPFRFQGSQSTTLVSAPVVEGDVATLTLSLNSLTAGAYVTSKHYVKFNTGTKDGRFYDITTNTANTLTIDLNGDNLTGAAPGDSVVIAEYWTLNTLFPPAGATTSWTETPASSGTWVPNGHAIVNTDSAFSRKTELLIPNYSGVGTNLSTKLTFFINGGQWKVIGSGAPAIPGSFVLYPDNYIIIRHNSNVLRNTVFRCIGEVETGSMAIPLATRTSGKQDSLLAILRPIAVSLNNLNLSTTAFVTTASAFSRKDELLVFNNEVALRNKSASATYFRMIDPTTQQLSWRSTTTGANPQDSALIPAGAGMIIRKTATTGGETVFWLNSPSY